MVKIVKINTINDVINYNTNSKKYSNYKNIMYIYLLKSCYHCESLKPNLNKFYKKIMQNKSNNVLVIEIDAEYLPQTNIPYISEFPTIVFFKNKKRIEFDKKRTVRNILSFYKSNLLKKTITKQNITKGRVIKRGLTKKSKKL